jgi:hypothetical protein
VPSLYAIHYPLWRQGVLWSHINQLDDESLFLILHESLDQVPPLAPQIELYTMLASFYARYDHLCHVMSCHAIICCVYDMDMIRYDIIVVECMK